MNTIPRWLFAAAVVVCVGLVAPNVIEAQTCETCNNLTGSCESDEDPDDRCYQGIDWEAGELYCASWGSILDCSDPWLRSADIGADGTLDGAAMFASTSGVSVTTPFTAQGPDSRYVRDCRGRVVARSYTPEESADMRRRTAAIKV